MQWFQHSVNFSFDLTTFNNMIETFYGNHTNMRRPRKRREKENWIKWLTISTISTISNGNENNDTREKRVRILLKWLILFISLLIESSSSDALMRHIVVSYSVRWRFQQMHCGYWSMFIVQPGRVCVIWVH